MYNNTNDYHALYLDNYLQSDIDSPDLLVEPDVELDVEPDVELDVELDVVFDAEPDVLLLVCDLFFLLILIYLHFVYISILC